MKIIFTVLLIGFSLNGYAFGFKGLEVGEPSSWAEIANTLNIECSDKVTNGLYCSGDTTILGKSAKASVQTNKAEILQSVLITFEPGGFEEILKTLVDKYGKPKSIKKSKLSNSMGASFEQVDVIWAGKDTRMNLKRYSDSVVEGTLWIYTNEHFKELTDSVNKNKSDI